MDGRGVTVKEALSVVAMVGGGGEGGILSKTS